MKRYVLIAIAWFTLGAVTDYRFSKPKVVTISDQIYIFDCVHEDCRFVNDHQEWKI